MIGKNAQRIWKEINTQEIGTLFRKLLQPVRHLKLKSLIILMH